MQYSDEQCNGKSPTLRDGEWNLFKKFSFVSSRTNLHTFYVISLTQKLSARQTLFWILTNPVCIKSFKFPKIPFRKSTYNILIKNYKPIISTSLIILALETTWETDSI